MEFKLFHTNLNVLDLDRSIAFYKEAFGLNVVRTVEVGNGACVMAFLSDGVNKHTIELTWLRDRKEPYELGDNLFHIALTSANYEEGFELHKRMGCYHHGDPDTGRYFVADPDGYILEIFPFPPRPVTF